MTSTTTDTTRDHVGRDGGRPVSAGAATAYSYLVDVITLLIVVQALLAGVFLKKDGARDSYGSWISAHGRVADVTVLLAIASAVLALVKLRARWDLAIGSSVLAVLLIAEAYIGGLIKDDGKDALTVVHIPLAVALMGLSVGLVVRGIALRRTATGGNG